MWSWFKGEYILPPIVSWDSFEGERILPLKPQESVLIAWRGEPRNNACLNFKAISQHGVEDLCVYCKNAVEQFVEDNRRCRFSFDRDQKQRKRGTYGWDNDSLSQLVSTMELPIHVLLPKVEDNLDIRRVQFSIPRIRANVRYLASVAGDFYDRVKDDTVHIHFFATGYISAREHARGAFITKMNRLHRVIAEIDDTTLKQRMLAMSI